MILGVDDQLFWILFGVTLGGVVFLIVIINLWICYCNKWYKVKEKGATKREKGMVQLQTNRTVGGESMSQVIFKSQPNGTMDRVNQNNMPYKTMDPETNTVRYETAHNDRSKASYSHDSGVAGSPASSSHHGSVHHDAEGSPTSTQAAADVHISFNDPGPSEQGYMHKMAEDSDSQSSTSDPNSNARRPYYSMPPAPISEPPPLTPGTPPPDSPISFEESFPPPPPAAPAPPPPSEAPKNVEGMYASIDKNRRSQTAPSSNTDSMMASVWRPRDSSEIQIIEK